LTQDKNEQFNIDCPKTGKVLGIEGKEPFEDGAKVVMQTPNGGPG
jgi:hypothetical protein